MKPCACPAPRRRVPMRNSGQRDHERRRRGHEAEGHDPVVEGVARGAQDREGGHVRAEQRHQEHERAQRAARPGSSPRPPALPRGAAEGEDADVDDDGEVDEDDRARGSRRGAPRAARSASSLEVAGQACVTSSPIRSGAATAEGRVVEEADRQEAEHERPRRAPEPDVLVQQRRAASDGEDEQGASSSAWQRRSKRGPCARQRRRHVKRCVAHASTRARPRGRPARNSSAASAGVRAE